MRAPQAWVAWVLLLSCGGAQARPERVDEAYRDGERVFAALRAEPVILLAEHPTTEALLVELQSTVAAYASRADAALQAYQRAERQPWRLRGLIRAEEAYLFAAELVREARIMLPIDVRDRIQADPEAAEEIEGGFRAHVQSVLLQTAQRLRCRALRLLEELLPSRLAGADPADRRRAEELQSQLTGACGSAG